MKQQELDAAFSQLSLLAQDCFAMLLSEIRREDYPQIDFSHKDWREKIVQYSVDIDDNEEMPSSNYDIAAQWQKFKESLPQETPAAQLANYQLSFTAHAVGLKILHQEEVEKIYRQKKAQYLALDDEKTLALMRLVNKAFADVLRGLDLEENLLKLVFVKLGSDFLVPLDLIKIAQNPQELDRFFAKFKEALPEKKFPDDFKEKFLAVINREFPSYRRELCNRESFVVSTWADFFATLRLMKRSEAREEKAVNFESRDFAPRETKTFTLNYAVCERIYYQRNVASFGKRRVIKLPFMEGCAQVREVLQSEADPRNLADLVLNFFDRKDEISAISYERKRQKIVEMHNLFFGSEVEKNPANFLANKLFFEMIKIGELSWEDLLSQAPMALENSAKIAEDLNELYRNYMPSCDVLLPRISDEKADRSSLEQMINSEANIIKKWLNFSKERIVCDESEEFVQALDGSEEINPNRLFNFLESAMKMLKYQFKDDASHDRPAKRVNASQAIPLQGREGRAATPQ